MNRPSPPPRSAPRRRRVGDRTAQVKPARRHAAWPRRWRRLEHDPAPPLTHPRLCPLRKCPHRRLKFPARLQTIRPRSLRVSSACEPLLDGPSKWPKRARFPLRILSPKGPQGAALRFTVICRFMAVGWYTRTAGSAKPSCDRDPRRAVGIDAPSPPETRAPSSPTYASPSARSSSSVRHAPLTCAQKLDFRLC